MHTLQRRGSVESDDLAAALGDYVVIDVRDRSEWDQGHIPGSAHVPLDVLRAGWSPVDTRLPVAVLADEAVEADMAVAMLVDRGCDAITIRGGAAAWRAGRQCMVTNRC